MEVDYLIIGQGISGSFLSWYLLKAGKKIVVIDDANPNAASRVASGVINPVTGRRIVSTWMINELLPFADEAYTAFGKYLNTAIISQNNILDFHPTSQMQQAFIERQKVESTYLRVPEQEEEYKSYFNFNYSVGEITPCYLINLALLIGGWKQKLHENNALLKERFEFCYFDTNAFSDKIKYKDIEAQKIIFCDGAVGADSPYFKLLPYAKNKGEALIIEIEGLPDNNIYKQGISLVPWKDNLWWVGSSYEWNFKDLNPSETFRHNMERQLKLWLKLPYKIVDHLATERPANLERRPFVGFHPLHTNVCLLNGMGTKGCSLAPYFANELVNCLLYNTPINPLADINRFKKILSR